MKKIIAILMLCFIAANVEAQMLKPTSGLILSERYDSSITLKKGEYIVQGEVVIAKTSLLTIESGVKLFFMPGATINVKGGLHVTGAANDLVQFSSAGGKESGTGLVISGSTPNQDIKISYASFKFLLKPLLFEKNWYRSGVEVNNSDFFNTYEFNDAVSIKEVEFYLNKQPIEFIFKENVFADNYSNISVYNATSYRVKYTFEKNVFANNLYFDSRTKAESNPVYVALDNIQSKYTMKIYNNMFSDNYIFTQDSLKQIDHGTIGYLNPKEDFVTVNNFTKNPVEKRYDQKEPGYNVHAFPLELSENGKKVSQKIPVDSLAGKKIKIHFNTSIAKDQKDYKVFYNFIDTITGEILKKQIDGNYYFSHAAGNEADFGFESTVISEPIGYISIENLKNTDGVSVPSVNVGIIDFFEKCGSRSYKMENVTLAPIDIAKHNMLVDTTQNAIIPLDSIKVGKWEVALFGGISGYAGDLNHDWMHQEKWYNGIALKLRYHINRNISAKLALDYTNISAKDYGLYNRRALSFKSNIWALSFMGEYNFTDRYSLNRNRYAHGLGRKIYPSFGIGLGLVKFNPKAQYADGTWYELRQFGTEGQTAPGGKKYSLITVTIPMMAAVSYRINDNFKISAELTGFKLFTDYIDDASKTKYVSDATVRAANPNNPDVASYFRNPGKNIGARGNAKDKDFIYMLGFSLNYRFKNKRDREQD
ncbi:hypothetical protein ACQ33O_12920 [Ferruginibacter sp. SUN002]|uniref:hypothetical protein n=1 Tax=Ferruginibacter sp. SUN002 TaxID=2937789 RepID=UPI003D3634E3